MEQGDYNTARSQLETSIAIYREVGHKYRIASGLEWLAELELCAGNYQAVRPIVEEVGILSREMGAPDDSPYYLAYVALAEGDTPTARSLLRECWSQLPEPHSPDYLTSILLGLSAANLKAIEVAEKRDEAGDAGEESKAMAARNARSLGAMEASRLASGLRLRGWERLVYERTLAAIRGELDEAAFEAARAEGQAMSMEQAVVYALEEARERG